VKQGQPRRRRSPPSVGHPMKRRDDLITHVRLLEEDAARRQLTFFHIVSRMSQEFRSGPALSNCGGQLDAVHRAGHVDVGEDNPYIAAGFKNTNRMIGVARLNGVETGRLDDINRSHTEDRFVLHNENDDFELRFHLRRPAREWAVNAAF
jgi:hypothetical protein